MFLRDEKMFWKMYSLQHKPKREKKNYKCIYIFLGQTNYEKPNKVT